MNSRIRTNSKKGVVYAILFVALLLHAWWSEQTAKTETNTMITTETE